jgi:hypothetical protein
LLAERDVRAIFPEYEVMSFEAARRRANKTLCKLVALVGRPDKLGVRDVFQLVFLLAMVTFGVAFLVGGFYLAAMYAVKWGNL